MRADMDPSITMKFLLPLALVPVTVLTRAALVATMDLPGSMMIVSPRSSTTPLIVSIRSFGVGSWSPLQPHSGNRHQVHQSVSCKASSMYNVTPDAGEIPYLR